MARLTVEESNVTVRLAVQDVPSVRVSGPPCSFELQPAVLRLSYVWGDGEWQPDWAIQGRVLQDCPCADETADTDETVRRVDLAEVPRWVDEAVYEFRPSVDLGRSAEIAADMADDGPRCRVCGCTNNVRCEGGCQWVPDPHGGDAWTGSGEADAPSGICSSHFIPATDLAEGMRVRSAEWADGDLVRIIAATPTPEGQVAVRYQDTAAHRPATLVHVNPGFPVLPEGGDAL